MKMMSATIVAALILAAPAIGSEDRTAQIASALFENMSITFACKKAVGDAHYTAARTAAKDNLTQLIGSEQAVLYVDEMDRKLKTDPRVNTMKIEPSKCYSMMSDAKHKIEVEKAKHVD